MSAGSEIGRLAALALAAAVCLTGFSMKDIPFEVLKQRPRQRPERASYEAERAAGAWVVTIHAGRKPTGGYSVEVRRVTEEGPRCVVHYAVVGPPPDAMVPQVITYPAAMVRFTSECGEVGVSPPLPRTGGEER